MIQIKNKIWLFFDIILVFKHPLSFIERFFHIYRGMVDILVQFRMVLCMNCIKLLANSVFLDTFSWCLFLFLKFALDIFLHQNFHSVHYIKLKIYNRYAWLFAILFGAFIGNFWSFLALFDQFKIFEFDFPRHYWLNDVIFLIPSIKSLLKWDRHAIRLLKFC